MAIFRDEQRRIAAIEAMLKPVHRAGCGVGNLSAEQRKVYSRHLREMDAWRKSFATGDEFYKALCSGEGPQMREDVHRAIFGKYLILDGDTFEEAQRKYMDYIS